MQPTCGPLTNRAKMRATYVSFVLSALQVRLSYIPRTRHIRVRESYIEMQVGSKAQVPGTCIVIAWRSLLPTILNLRHARRTQG